MSSHYEINVFKLIYLQNLMRMHMTSSPSLAPLMLSHVHVRRRILGSHSLHSFAEFLQSHINSPEASSCQSSRLKPLKVLKPFSLHFMATEKSARKGGRQRRGNTSKDLPPDLHEMYKTDPEETYTERNNQIQWIRRYWEEEWFRYRFITKEYVEKNAIKAP